MTLDERLESLRAGERGHLDWRDVQSRARALEAPRRRRILIAAVVALAVALIPTAVALRGVVEISFWSSQRAPEPIMRSFEATHHGWPTQMERVGVVSSESRRIVDVRRAGIHRTLWVAPTESGGFCWILEIVPAPQGSTSRGGSGGCGIRHGGRMHAGVDQMGPALTVTGRVRDRSIAKIDVRYADGVTEEIPIHWVSEPIGVGFFIHPLAADRRGDRRATEVIARDVTGRIVKTERLR